MRLAHRISKFKLRVLDQKLEREVKHEELRVKVEELKS